MKAKIDLFAKGVFEYDKPELILSAQIIGISVEMGKVFRGSFCVSSSSGRPFKGIVYSSESLLKIEQNTFTAASNDISFSFDATHLDINDSIKGRITVVSELGEHELPFYAQVQAPSCDTVVGPVSDLFHYANLAQTCWQDARNLFKTSEFARTLSFHDHRYDNLYRTLLRSGNTSLALEEFLVAVHKKLPVRVTTKSRELVVDMAESSDDETVSFTVTLKRDTWGYIQLGVETDSFIEPERKVIWGDDFTDSEFALECRIRREQLHSGKNNGRIVISSIHDRIEIDVICRNTPKDFKRILSDRRRKQLETRLLLNYMDYRMGRLLPGKYVAESESVLGSLRALHPETVREQLLRVHLLITAGKESQAKTVLDMIDEDNDVDSLVMYAVILYFRALLAKDNATFIDLSMRIRELYNREQSPFMYILCINLDRRKRLSLPARYDALKRCWHNNGNSPLVYFEAVQVANEDPSVLKDFDGFDLHVLHFGLRNGLLNKSVISQAAYLAGRMKKTGRLAVDVLIRIFEKNKLNEVLEALCKQLIIGQFDNKTVFKWLLLGAAEQVCIKNLYEKCLLTMPENYTGVLPRPLLSYFESDIGLPDSTVAAFYANILGRRNSADTLSATLLSHIKEFTFEQMKKGRISDNLAILYNNLTEKDELDEECIRRLPDLVFKCSAAVPWTDAVTLLVSHKEREDEASYPVMDGMALIDIYTDNPVIALCDERTNRIVSYEPVTRRLINNPFLMQLCLEQCTNDERVVLNLFEASEYRDSDGSETELLKCCVEFPNLEKKFMLDCRKRLIEYYYDNLESELMESYLVRLDLSALLRTDRIRMIGLMIQRELYSLAIKNMELYGFMGVDVKRLSKLATRLIETSDDQTSNSVFMDICYLTFKKNRYTDRILEFLAQGYNGDSETMYEIWDACRNSGVNMGDLEERLLGQLLFTESEMSYARDVFARYYGQGGSGKLVTAYLSYTAYGSLVYDRLIDPEMIEIMRREQNYSDSDICTLALLKYYSMQTSFTEQERSYVELQLERMEQKGLILPFFRNFDDGIKTPAGMQDKYYIEYHTDPRKRVRIHYCLISGDGDDGYEVEDMRDIGFGIFVAEFVLFYGEILQYYISEEEGENCTITESSEICLEPELIGSDENRYHQLNLIITAREMNDYKTMQKLLEGYIRSDYICKRLFNPIIG